MSSDFTFSVLIQIKQSEKVLKNVKKSFNHEITLSELQKIIDEILVSNDFSSFDVSRVCFYDSDFEEYVDFDQNDILNKNTKLSVVIQVIIFIK